MKLRDDLEKLLLTEICVGSNKTSIEPNEDLLGQGIIDSLGLMKLLSFMEDTFDIKIRDDEIIPENFQSLTNILKLIEKQLLIK